MKDITEKNFGVIIAFWLPGFLLLWGLSYSSSDLETWLARSDQAAQPSVGSFLYVTLASLALGLLISAIRGVIVDRLFYVATRLPRANIDYAKLKDKSVLEAFQAAIENHYRYYQYYAHSFVSVVLAFAFYLSNERKFPSWQISMGVLAIAVILFFASRNELKKFNDKAGDITR